MLIHKNNLLPVLVNKNLRLRVHELLMASEEGHDRKSLIFTV